MSAGRYMPAAELEAYWPQTIEVYPNTSAVDVEPIDLGMHQAQKLLRSKNINPVHAAGLGLVRYLPMSATLPPSFSSAWARHHRLVTRAFDAAGVVRSIHARAVIAEANPKTLWPAGYSATGLVFADPAAQALLRGNVDVASELASVLVVEGLTDFVRAGMFATTHRDRLGMVAVLGITSGSASAFAEIKWPTHRDFKITVGTDNDAAGDAYAAALREAVPEHIRMTRIQLGRVEARS